jgi:hypothetical protein
VSSRITEIGEITRTGGSALHGHEYIKFGQENGKLDKVPFPLVPMGFPDDSV